MTEDPPMADPAVKLTKVQREARISILLAVSELGGEATWSQLCRRGMNFKRVEACVNRGEVEQPQWYIYRLTPAGRALLDALKDEGEGR